MKIEFNLAIPNAPQNILADLYFPLKNNGKLVLFCHGFKGFKDWGAWHLVAEHFARKGFVFVKFNFSHNGIGEDNLGEFTRLDLFRKNNYSKEIADVQTVLNWLDAYKPLEEFKINEYQIIGHSRGGGIAIASAAKDDRISKLATWASIANFDRFGSPEVLSAWQETGSRNFYNARTKQDMEIDYQFYEDYKAKEEQFNMKTLVENIQKPFLALHGTGDDSVGFSHAQRLKSWNPKVQLELIDNANHVFGAKHPYAEGLLPDDLQKVVDETVEFLH